MLPVSRAEFLTTFVYLRRLTRPGGFTGGHACCQHMSGTRPVQDVKGVLAHILLRGPGGHLHLMQKALANGRVSFLLASRPWGPPSSDAEGAG